MSKGLEAWEHIKEGIDTNEWKCSYWDDIELIEKELKALAVIKRYAKDIELYHDLCCLVDDDEDLKIVEEVLHNENNER